MATERIHIKVTQDGAKAVRKDLEGLGSGADKASKGMSLASSAVKGLAAIALGKAVQETIRLADAYTDLTNKVRFATRSENEMISVRQELFRVANQNRSSIEATADVYGKLRLSTQALGLSQSDVIELTDTLQKATVLSGASADQAANSLRQLGQGMAAGALRGDELNSVLENTPYIAQVIAESLGKDIGAIRQMGAEGKITGKIIADAFKGAREEIVDNFGKRVPTVGESLTVMTNVVTRLVGEVNDATGASAGLANMIISISTSVNEMVPEIAALSAELLSFKEFEGIFDGVFPKTDNEGVSTLQFMALMVSTLEDRALGAVNAMKKLALVTSGAGTGFDGIGDDLKMVLTGQGPATSRVLDTINEFRGGRRGVTTLNADPDDPHNTMAQRGKDTSKAPAEKGKGFAEILSGLETEHRLLQLSNDERRIAEGLIQAQESAQGRLSTTQLGQVESQLRKNNAIEIEKRLLDEVEERLSKQLEHELELMEAEKETKKVYQDILTDLDTQRRLTFMTNEEREIAIGLIDAQHSAQGKLNDEQLRTVELSMRRNQLLDPSEMPKDFGGAMNFMGKEFMTDLRTFGQEMAMIFGPGGSIHQGLNGIVGSLSDVIGQSIAFGASWDDTVEAIKNVGRSIIAEIISSLIRIPIQMAINETIASGLRAKATAETVGQAGVVTAAMAPAAAATSLATAGTNISGATAAIIGVAALATGVLAGAAMFEDGGYTGNGGRGAVAGLVHGQEYVVNAEATARYRGQLEAMNSGTYRPAAGGGGGKMQVTILNQASGVEFETRQVDDRRIEIIARRMVQQHAPEVIAQDMRSPQSRTGKAVTQTTTAKRVRS
jgi:tape measure domain-containing protein